MSEWSPLRRASPADFSGGPVPVPAAVPVGPSVPFFASPGVSCCRARSSACSDPCAGRCCDVVSCPGCPLSLWLQYKRRCMLSVSTACCPFPVLHSIAVMMADGCYCGMMGKFGPNRRAIKAKAMLHTKCMPIYVKYKQNGCQ